MSRRREGSPDLPASSRIRMDVFLDWSEASLAVTAHGRDLPELVKSRLRELCIRRIDWIGLDLPLGEPAVAYLSCLPLPFPALWRPAGLIATVEDPAAAGTILAHLGLLHPADSPGPATFTAQTTLPVE